jgi:predicted methyltransferase
MSLTQGLSKEMWRILQAITEDPMDFEKLVERTEIVGPELNYYLVRLRRRGLVEYNEMSPTVRLTDEGRKVVAELQVAPLVA